MPVVQGFRGFFAHRTNRTPIFCLHSKACSGLQKWTGCWWAYWNRRTTATPPTPMPWVAWHQEHWIPGLMMMVRIR